MSNAQNSFPVHSFKLCPSQEKKTSFFGSYLQTHRLFLFVSTLRKVTPKFSLYSPLFYPLLAMMMIHPLCTSLYSAIFFPLLFSLPVCFVIFFCSGYCISTTTQELYVHTCIFICYCHTGCPETIVSSISVQIDISSSQRRATHFIA